MKKSFLKLVLCLLLALSANPVFAQTVGLSVKPTTLTGILNQNVIYGVDPNSSAAQVGTSLLLLERPAGTARFRVDGDGVLLSGTIPWARVTNAPLTGSGGQFSIIGNSGWDTTAKLNITNGATDFGRTNLVLTGRFQAGNDGWQFGTGARNTIVFASNANASGVNVGGAGTEQYSLQVEGNSNSLGFLSRTVGNTPVMTLVQGGNVGIGTTGPGAKLHVVGGQILSTSGTSANSRTLTLLDTTDSQYNFGSYNGSWRSALQIQNNDASKLLFIAPPETDYNYAIFRSATGGMKFDVGGTLATIGTNAITIDSSANVAIGTSDTSAGGFTVYAARPHIFKGTIGGGDSGIGFTFDNGMYSRIYATNNSYASAPHLWLGVQDNNSIIDIADAAVGISKYVNIYNGLTVTSGLNVNSGLNVSGHTNLGGGNDPSNDQGNNWLTWGYRADNNPYYAIRTNYKAYGSYTYSRLQIGWHTGLEIGAASSYGGTRFYNNSPFTGSQIMSIGDGDNNVRINNNLYVDGDIKAGASSNRYVDAGRLYLNNSDWHSWGNSIIDGRVWSTNSNIHLSPPGGYNVVINADYRDAGGGAGSAGLQVSGNMGIGTATTPNNRASFYADGSSEYYGIYSREVSGHQSWKTAIYGESTTPVGDNGSSNNFHMGVWGYAAGTATRNYGLMGVAEGATNNVGVVGKVGNNSAFPSGNWSGWFVGAPLYVENNIAIGTQSASNKLIAIDVTTSNDTPAVRGVHAVTDYYGIGVEGEGKFMGVRGNCSAGSGGGCYGGYFYAYAGSSNSVGIYASGSTWAGDFSGRIRASNGGEFNGVTYFRSYKSGQTVGASDSYSLEAFSDDGGPAAMSFHRGGYYAVNMGLDSDNVLRIGGWSADANRWQLDMSGNEYLAGGQNLVGNLNINNGSPTIYLQDSDNRSAMIHNNSNIFYVLRGCGNNSGTWCTTANGMWPLEINLENNAATFGGPIAVSGAVNTNNGITAYGNYAVWGSGNTVGVYGQAGSGYGVYGWANTGGTGVYGVAAGTSGNAVSGYAANANSYAGYFSGKVTVTGILSKGGGSFLIDNPLNPKEENLQHSFVESPEMRNLYYGQAETVNGRVEIALPEWWQALNGKDKAEYNYQMTPMGKWCNLYVAEEIENNKFAVGTNDGNCKFSWQVSAIRHDAFAEKNRIPVVTEKEASQKGACIHPEACK